MVGQLTSSGDLLMFPAKNERLETFGFVGDIAGRGL
jgi:hypothetical protein